MFEDFVRDSGFAGAEGFRERIIPHARLIQ